MKGKTEILLLNSAAALPPHPSFVLSRKEHLAPLGLFCLAEVAPERMTVIDLQFSLPSEDFFCDLDCNEIKTVIVRAGRNHSKEYLRALISSCRRIFAAARVGLAGTINKSFVNLGDFYIYGTGHISVLNALRGEKLSGFINHMQEELQMQLPIPENMFPEVYCFNAPPEKNLGRKTLEVAQPWLGLHEFSEKFRTYPGLRWFSELAQWLKRSGFAELHFRPSGLKPSCLHEIRSVMLNLKVEFAVSFVEVQPEDLKNNCAGAPLRQIWFYRPRNEESKELVKCLQIISEERCGAGLALNTDSAEMENLDKMLSLIDRMSLIDPEVWDLPDLKKVLYRFWGSKNRFFKQLFNICSAHDLVEFMKISAFILEILFSSNRSKR